MYSNPLIYGAIDSKKAEVNRVTMQIEVRANKKFGDLNRNNVNRGYVNQGITVLITWYIQSLFFSHIRMSVFDVVKSLYVDCQIRDNCVTLRSLLGFQLRVISNSFVSNFSLKKLKFFLFDDTSDLEIEFLVIYIM